MRTRRSRASWPAGGFRHARSGISCHGAASGAARRTPARLVRRRFHSARRSMSWPAVRLGRRRSTALWRFASRGGLRSPGTLAADRLDLSDTPFARPRGHRLASGAPSLSTGPLTAGAISTCAFRPHARIGWLRLDDMAANIMVRPGRIEDARPRRAQQRRRQGAPGLAAAVSGLVLRAQGSFERLDVAALLSDFGQNGWMAGSAQGQFVLEARASPQRTWFAKATARDVAIRSGELIGIGRRLVAAPIAVRSRRRSVGAAAVPRSIRPRSP